MKKLMCQVTLIVLVSIASVPVAQSQVVRGENAGLVEEFSFVIKDFKIDHQGELNTLNISISYRYVPNITRADYRDFRLLEKDIETLLTHYPNEDDYWEIVNKQLTAMLLRKYPALASVTSELRVEPSRVVPYARSSRVTRFAGKRAGKKLEVVH